MSVLDYQGNPLNNLNQLTINAADHGRAIRQKGINPIGTALIDMLQGWENYAIAHKKRYESPIGNDYVLGEYWAETGLAIKRLLDGETGGLDSGSISANIIKIIEQENFVTDGYNLIENDN